MFTMKMLAARMMRFMMRPIRMKSLKRYPPGPYTSMWVGEPIGVAKLLLTLIIRAIRNGKGS